jgi:superfamily II DNA or RNA helicase
MMKAKYPPFKDMKWQKYIIMILRELITTYKKKAVQIKLHTGHGKSVVIQMLARTLGTKVIIVCLNSFLKNWSIMLYGASDS